jgi:hypothetical protein
MGIYRKTLVFFYNVWFDRRRRTNLLPNESFVIEFVAPFVKYNKLVYSFARSAHTSAD